MIVNSCVFFTIESTSAIAQGLLHPHFPSPLHGKLVQVAGIIIVDEHQTNPEVGACRPLIAATLFYQARYGLL